MVEGKITIIIFCKDKTNLVFPHVSDFETVANRLEITSELYAGQITADIDLQKVEHIIIEDDEKENLKEDVDKEQPKDLQ